MILSPSTLELTLGWDLRASTAASAKNGRKLSLVPSRVSKSRLARSRSLAILVTSTSSTLVSCADTCSDSTMRAAMTLRNRLIFSVVPRFGETLTWTVEAAGPGALAGAGATTTVAAAAESRTSCLRIRPPMPVPLIEERSTLLSLASFRTNGVT